MLASLAAAGYSRVKMERSTEANPRESAIYRSTNGSIDIDRYKRRVRRLRIRWLRLQWYRCIRYVVWLWRRRSLEAELYSLDQETLKDIGIDRSDIPRLVKTAYFQGKHFP